MGRRVSCNPEQGVTTVTAHNGGDMADQKRTQQSNQQRQPRRSGDDEWSGSESQRERSTREPASTADDRQEHERRNMSGSSRDSESLDRESDLDSALESDPSSDVDIDHDGSDR